MIRSTSSRQISAPPPRPPLKEKHKVKHLLLCLLDDIKSCDQSTIEKLDNSRLSNNTLLEELEEILDELNGRPYTIDEEHHLNKVIDATNTYYNTLTKLQPESTEQSVNNLNVIARALGFELPDILILDSNRSSASAFKFIPNIEDSLLMAEDDMEEAIHALAEAELMMSVHGHDNGINHASVNIIAGLEDDCENLASEIEMLKNALENSKVAEQLANNLVGDLEQKLNNNVDTHRIELFKEHEQLAVLQKTIEDKEISIARLETTASSNKAVLETTRTEVKQLRAALAKERETNAKLNETIKTERGQNNALQGKLSNLRASAVVDEKLQKKYYQIQNNLGIEQKKVHQLTNQIRQKEVELLQYKPRVTEQTQQIADLQAKLISTQSKIDSVKKLADNNVRLYRNKSKENKTLTQRIETSTDQINELKNDVEKLQTQNRQLSEKLKIVVNEANVQNLIVSQLKEEKETLLATQIQDRAQLDLSYAEEQCTKAMEKIEEISSLMEIGNINNKKVCNILNNDLSADLELEMSKNEKLEQQISDLERLMDGANELIPVLQRSVKDKDDIIDRLRTEALEKLDDEKKKAIREQQVLDAEIRTMRQRMTSQEEKIYELNNLVKKREGSQIDERKSAEELKRMILKQENTLNEKRSLLEIKEEQVSTLREEITDLSQLIEITSSTQKQTQISPNDTVQVQAQKLTVKLTRTNEILEDTVTKKFSAPLMKAKPIKPARRHTEHIIDFTSPKPYNPSEKYSVVQGKMFKFGHNDH